MTTSVCTSLLVKVKKSACISSRLRQSDFSVNPQQEMCAEKLLLSTVKRQNLHTSHVAHQPELIPVFVA